MNVIVIGGGIAGLTASYRLLKAGANVTLLEGSDQLGGLGTFFGWRGRYIDRFYHCTMPSDEHLLGLVDELRIRHLYDWRETTMGMVAQGQHYDFTTPLDLLRFNPLSLPQRARLGAGALLMRRLGQGKDLDLISAEEWLTRIFGKALWEQVWHPLFRSKFGEDAGSVPALYIWSRSGREGNKATRGYPRGGYYATINSLRNAITRQGGEIVMNSLVGGIEQVDGHVLVDDNKVTRKADWVISTLPLTVLQRSVRGDLAHELHVPKLPYMGVVNLLVFTREPLTEHYWTPVVNSATDFDGVVQMSALTGTGHFDGLHLAYLMRYTDRNSKLFATADSTIQGDWLNQLGRLYPEIRAGGVVDSRLFKAPFVEPIWPLGYKATKPGHRVGNRRLFLATTAQVYPNVTSWNSSVGLANAVVADLLEAAGE